MSGPIDASLRKFHASLNVSDLPRSVAFYRVLFGIEPAKVKANYAKFDLADPPLVLSLIPGQPSASGHLNHAGLRVRTAGELVEIQRRLEEAGLHTTREEGVACCYATQTKFWVTDPDRALWEIYIFHEDLDEQGEGHVPDVGGMTAPIQLRPPLPLKPTVTWEHRLQDPVPARIPHDDNSVHGVNLEGSINVPPDAAHRADLLREAFRVLRPGAEIRVHGLAGDRRHEGALALPGPAAAVRHVPTPREVSDELERAGFVDVFLEVLSETAYFVVDGVGMRELRVRARKPGHRPTSATHQAVYRGPLGQVTDDFGNVFRRGEPTAINVHDWQVLSKSAAAESFLFLSSGDPGKDASRATTGRPPTAGPSAA